MWPYWLMFLVPAIAAFKESAKSSNAALVKRMRWSAGAILVAICITLLIGYRFEVGGDWGAYLRQFDDVQAMDLGDIVVHSDPGYALLNWVSGILGLDIFGVNLVCGAIFAAGLLRFCRSLPRPWLAITVAVPYMLIVVAMGYSRQGVALAFSMLGLAALKGRSIFWFIAWGVLGATFHKTAVLILPIAALAGSRNKILTLTLVAITTYVGYLTLLQDSFDTMYTSYVGSDMQSQGAMVRLLMNGIPAVILLLWGKRFRFDAHERSLWRWMAFISLILLCGLVAVPSASTAVDRMALYLLPLQLVVFSHLPELVTSRAANGRLISAGIVLYYAIVLFIWLNFGNFSFYWVPYRFYPLELL